jgi:hypothetical protein
VPRALRLVRNGEASVLGSQSSTAEQAASRSGVHDAQRPPQQSPLEAGWRCLRWHVNRELWLHEGGKLVEIQKRSAWTARIVKVTAWRPVKCLAEALEMEP